MPPTIKNLSLPISDQTYCLFMKIVKLSLLGILFLGSAWYVWADFQRLKNQEQTDLFFRGHQFYQTAASESFFKPIEDVLKTRSLNANDQQMCQKAQETTKQGLYFFVNHDILKRDIYLSICQNKLKEAIDAYVRMSLYFYAPKTWSKDLVAQMQTFVDPKYGQFIQMMQSTKIKTQDTPIQK
jgi:hypothetical protein